jgi:thiol-disulfide isomerase/thioredoxin
VATQRKPLGTPGTPGPRPANRPLTKKQRRNQAAARSVSLSHRPPWQSPTVITSVSVGIVAVVLIIIVVLNQVGNGGTGAAAVPISSTVSSVLLHPNASVVSTVGSGGQAGGMVRLPGDTVLKDKSGKPMIVYVGAEYCPFCAAERWSIVYWLSQFGTFKGLTQLQSSSTDVDPNTDTVTFHNVTYTSSVIDFSHTELLDRNQNTLETPTSQVESIFTKYDTPPYTTQAQGFPFVDIGGLYVLYSTSYDPALLKGLTWDQIANKLKDPNDPVTKAIVGNANIMTAATCIATGDQPASVCSSSTIQAIEPTLKSLKPPSA